MRYLGGKARIARRLCSVLQEAAPGGRLWWEPFMGGAGMTERLAETFPGGVASDGNGAVASMWAAALAGWVPPACVTDVDYREARDFPDSDPRKAFILAGCSFAGKYAGGLARNSAGYNYAAAQSRRVVEAARAMRHGGWAVRAGSTDFFSAVPRGDINLYCDPPYAGTTGYAGAAWDAAVFWARCREWARVGAFVAVSEYQAPADCVVLWEGGKTLGLRTRAGGNERRRELLVQVVAP